MSCFGSTRTNFSTSEMSLASSALMTALSISDADYETSDEQLLSPQVLNEAEISQSSSNLRWSSSLLSSQSVSCLAEATSEDFVTSLDADKYAMTVKSDTCLNQQSKIISDFINDMRLQEQQLQNEERNSSALSNKNSATSVQTEFYPATNASDSPYGSIIDMNIEDSTDVMSEKEIAAREEPCIEYSVEYNPDEEEEEKASPRLEEKEEEEAVRSTLSETRHKIIENLAQVTSDKLFSKTTMGLRHHHHHHLNSGSSMTKVAAAAAVRRSIESQSQGEPQEQVRRVTSRRPFQRCRGVESLLQIDYELQPLNLMLSRLLAEFRAMDLKGKLGYVDPDQNSFIIPPESLTKRANTFKDVQSRFAHQRKEEEDGTCMKFLCSLSHEYLNSDNPATSSSSSKEANTSIAQISRSCEDNCLLSRDSTFAKANSCRLKSAGKHSECNSSSSSEAERNPRCHRETSSGCYADDRQKTSSSISEEDQFGSGSSGVFRLMEITSTN